MENNITNQPTWVKTGKQILDLKLTEVPTLVTPIIPKYGAISLAGSSDLGKSYLLLQLAHAIITGSENFLGFKLNASHNSVIYLSTEDDEYSLCPRLTNMSKEITNLSNYDNLRVLFETKDLIKRLDSLLTSKSADIVIIDTFTDVFDGDMNQANKVRSFIQQFKELGVKHKTLLIFNHHCGKKNDYRAPHKDNLLGSQGFESSMRVVFELRKDFNNPEIRHLCIVKGNYLTEEYKNSSFALHFNFKDGFRNTGTRTNFDKLIKSEDQQHLKNAKRERVLALKESGLSYRQISEKLKEEGIEVSKTVVGDICNYNCPSVLIPLEKTSDGQAA
ncbi:MAG: AAA family ATPase [Chitinophagaceae bacterium]